MTTAGEKNRRYRRNQVAGSLTPRFGRTLLLWVLLVGAFLAIFELAQQDPGTLFASSPRAAAALRWLNANLGGVILAGFVTLFVAFVSVRRARGRILLAAYRESLQKPDPTRLIELLSWEAARDRRADDRDATAAYLEAQAHVVYGNPAEARKALATVDWEMRAPIVHAMGLYVEAQLAMLCEGDPHGGLSLAVRAQEMTALGGKEPPFSVIVALGEVLCGVVNPDTIRGLEIVAAKPERLLVRFLAAYALVVAYTRSGETAKAEPWRRLLETEAPHCRPLHRMPGSGDAAPKVAAESVAPSNAVAENRWSRPAKSHIRRWIVITVVGWGVLILLFALAQIAFG